MIYLKYDENPVDLGPGSQTKNKTESDDLGRYRNGYKSSWDTLYIPHIIRLAAVVPRRTGAGAYSALIPGGVGEI